MTEEAKIFHEEVREKSITARSAHNKSRRSVKPSYEQPAGPVRSINLNKPIDYQAFKNWDKATQAQYLEGIIAKYNVGAYVICQVMNCSGTSIAKICRELKIKTPEYTSKKECEAFLKDFARPAVVSEPEPKMSVQDTTVSLSGAYDASAIAAYIKGLFPAGAKAHVTITVKAI